MMAPSAELWSASPSAAPVRKRSCDLLSIEDAADEHDVQDVLAGSRVEGGGWCGGAFEEERAVLHDSSVALSQDLWDPVEAFDCKKEASVVDRVQSIDTPSSEALRDPADSLSDSPESQHLTLVTSIERLDECSPFEG